MKNSISTFIFISTGAFAIWMTKGFKGPFDKEMVSIAERNSPKGLLRFFIGIGIWFSVLAIVTALLASPPVSKKYKVKTNKKGEIIRLEEVK